VLPAHVAAYVERVATVSAVLTVGFSHARYLSGNRTSSIWMGHDAENKSSVISFQLSVTTAGKAIADSGQLIPNPQPRAPIPQPFPHGIQLFQLLSPKGATHPALIGSFRAPKALGPSSMEETLCERLDNSPRKV
jgi:hypothetical protein